MDHKVSKDMISSGMIPSGEKTQADLGRTQYGSAPSPTSLMEAYRSIYEHHQKDADGKVIEHGEKEELNEGKMPEGLKNYLMKKGKKKDEKDVKEMYGSGGSTNTTTTTKPNTTPTTQAKKPGLIQRMKNRTAATNQAINQMNDVDLFDLVKGKLIDEGCDEQEAINIMVNLSEDELNEISEGLAGMALKLGGLAAGAYGVKKAAEKMGTMSGTPKSSPVAVPSPTAPKPKKPGLIQKLKDRKDATNKAIEQM